MSLLSIIIIIVTCTFGAIANVAIPDKFGYIFGFVIGFGLATVLQLIL